MTSKADFTKWLADDMRAHLRELGLQTSGKKGEMAERLRLHYMGIAQVKKGCSIATTAAHKVGMAQPPRSSGRFGQL